MAEEAEKIGRRMRERREELPGEITQRECAERMPGTVQASEWSRWERGKHRPEELDEVAKALKTTVADLVAGPLSEREEPEDQDLMGKLSESEKPAVVHLEDRLVSVEEKLDRLLEKSDRPTEPAEDDETQEDAEEKTRADAGSDATTDADEPGAAEETGS